ncbi:dipeptidase [Cystobacter fuscus]
MEPEALRRAGVRPVLATVWPPNALRPGRSALGEALHQLALLEDFARRSPDFVLAHGAGEARQSLASGQLVLVPTVEGGEGIQRVEDVDLLYAAGARSITLVHFFDNSVADAADDQFGPLVGGLTNGGEGLTPLGVEVVRRMMELGLLIDVAHASDRTITEVLALTEPAGVPVVYSHTGAGWADTRCLSAPLARRVGAGGGLIGIGLFRSPFQQVPVEERWEDSSRERVTTTWRTGFTTCGRRGPRPSCWAVTSTASSSAPVLEEAVRGGCATREICRRCSPRWRRMG